jgi:hypothetical protein
MLNEVEAVAKRIRTIILWSLAALALLTLAVLPFTGSMAAPASQPELTPTATRTATATPAPTIDIGNAIPVACGQAFAGDTTGATNNVSVYSCAPWLPETGPERVFALSLQTSADVDALLGGLSNDLDLFLLTGANPASCIAFGDNAISLRGLAAGVYYLVVDGFDGASGPFQINVWCPLAVTPTPTPTVTPTVTPEPTLLRFFFPLLLRSLEPRH